MHRREFMNKAIAASAAATLPTIASEPAKAAETWTDLLNWRTGRENGDLLSRITTIADNARAMIRGFYYGHGLALHQLLEEDRVPMPTQPKRSHPAWPYIHCLCHCNGAANMGRDGQRWSIWSGVQDELPQAFFANMFRTQVYPLIVADVASGRYTGKKSDSDIKREVHVVMNYLFGDAKLRRQSIFLVALKNRASKERMVDLRRRVYPLIDACESAWQRADFVDNAMGRVGGCQCPKNLSSIEKLRWCSRWCTDRGVASDVAEGPGTGRPWGPYHPLYPGPIPTYHETIFGDMIPQVGSLLSQSHPLFDPVAKLVLPEDLTPAIAGMP